MKRELRHLGSSRVSKNGIKRESSLPPSSLQALEPRVLLSGNVQASVSEGNLIIRGDSAANVIVLDQTGLDTRRVRVSGASGTTINHQAGPVVLRGVRNGVDIKTGGGRDSVSLSDLNLPGNVLINGQRNLSLDNVRIAKTLNILSSATTTITNTKVDENLMIRSVSGGGTVALQSVDVLSNTQIIGGNGRDTFTIDDSIFHGPVRLRTGSGRDMVQIERHGGSSAPPSRFHQPVSILLGSDNDTLKVGVAGENGNRAVFSNVVNFDGGAGFDTLLNSGNSTFNKPSRVKIINFESNGVAPTASITAVSPDPRNTRVDSIQIVFSEAVTGFTTADLTLTGVDLTTATLTSENNITWTLGNLNALTGSAGTYTLSLDMTGLTNLAGTAGVGTVSEQWVKGITDTIAPTVISTDPVNQTTNVALNKMVAAIFSETMNPLTITPANFKVTAPGNILVAGTVTYVGTTATFTPTSPLASNTTYTATITTGAKDLVGNALASNFVWTFTTVAAPDTTAPTVNATNPLNNATGVAVNHKVAAIFSEAMNPLTITPANFKVTAPGNIPVAGTVTYVGTTATFTPTSPLASNTTYTATITTGAKDLVGNALASNFTWTFKTGTQIAQAPINLGVAGTFAVMATAAISGTGHITGDVGLNPGTAQGFPPASITGNIRVGGSEIVAAQAALLAAYNDAVSRSTTSVALAGNMGGLTFTPGLYTNSTSVLISGAGPGNNVTLDAQGDPNAIFIFKMGSTLTTGPGARVILAGGAKAGNIFWQVGSSATLDTTTIFKGNILAAVTITVNNGAVVEGRLFAGSGGAPSGAVTIDGGTVTLPLP